jgi:outer membrane protein assembly factor BamB
MRGAWLLLAVLGVFTFGGESFGASMPLEKPKSATQNVSAITFTTNPALARQLAEAETHIKGKEYPQAMRLLQGILDNAGEALFPLTQRGPHGKDYTRHVSLRREAERLLGTMPPDARALYGKQMGIRATVLLDEARMRKDSKMLGEVVHRFPFTPAAGEALYQLATEALDGGDLVPAALMLKQLTERVGDKGLVVGKRTLTAKDLQNDLDKVKSRLPAPSSDWPMQGGNPSRSARASGGAPLLDARCRTSTMHDDNDEPKTKHPDTETWVAMALTAQRQQQVPVVPGFFPIGVKGKVFYREYGGIQGMYLKAGEEADETGRRISHKAGDIVWKSRLDGALTSLLEGNDYKSLLTDYQAMYRAQLSGLIIEDTSVGTVTADRGYLYLVDELALPPHPQYLRRFMYNAGTPSYPGRMRDLVRGNYLRAYSIESGKLVWQLPDSRDPGELGASHFLGAPLPVGDSLYVLYEKKRELSLLRLFPRLLVPARPEGPQGAIATQRLGSVSNAVSDDIIRRTQAVNLAYSDGIVVVPTNVGEVLGVDIVGQRLLWAFQYSETNRADNAADRIARRRLVLEGRDPRLIEPMPDLASLFRSSPPVIHQSRVVFAAPLADATHCVDLQTGALHWSVPKTMDDLYLAGVFDDKVLIVGKTACRAVSLKDGKQLWSLTTGTPAGQGAAAKNIYYLPLGQGEICAIDLAKGQIQGRVKPRKPVFLGNLIFHDGFLISQSATEIAAFPVLASMVKEIDDGLRKNPNDPYTLTLRGRRLVADGKLAEAVDDFRAALANRPSRELLLELRLLLYETLDELLTARFAVAEKKYLSLYKEACTTEDKGETFRRQTRFLFVVGQGREQQGRLLEAFRHYLDYANRAGPEQLMPAPEEPTRRINPQVWVRGRINNLLRKATAQERKELEEEIRERFKELFAPEKGKG